MDGSGKPAVILSERDKARIREVHAALTGGDLRQAGVLAATAHADGIEHALILDLAAGRLEQDGRVEEALVLLRRAKELSPSSVGILNALGLSLQRLDRHEEAEAEFTAALLLMPEFGQAFANRGVSRVALSRLIDAREDFERALRLQAENLVALNGLAALAVRQGNAKEARLLADQVLSREPSFPGAVLTLAGADIAQGQASNAIQRLEAMLFENTASLLDLALARGLRGDALDAEGSYRQAFAAYAQAGEQFRAIYADRFSAAEPPQTFLRKLTLQMTQGAVMRAPATSAGGRRHVFLIGFPRSGTTLLEQVLEQHPDVVTMAERECFSDSVKLVMRNAQDFAAFSKWPESRIEPLRQAYWRSVSAYGVDPTGKTFVDKHPFHSFKLPLILRLFPHALILFAQRDPRDVVLSCFRHRFRISAPTFQFLSVQGTSSLYDATMELIERTSDVFMPNLLRLRLEDLITDFDGRMRALCDWMGIRWTERLRAFAERVSERGIATPSAAQLAEGLSDRGIGRWRAYTDDLAPVLPLIAPWVARYRYA